MLDSRTPDEVFVFGAVYIDVIPESYLKLAADIDAQRKLPNFLAIRKFSEPPQLSDLDGFTLEEEDVKQLKKCKLSRRKIQLSAASMEVWGSPLLTHHLAAAAERNTKSWPAIATILWTALSGVKVPTSLPLPSAATTGRMSRSL